MNLKKVFYFRLFVSKNISDCIMTNRLPNFESLKPFEEFAINLKGSFDQRNSKIYAYMLQACTCTSGLIGNSSY